MPYIKPHKRYVYDYVLNQLNQIGSKGDLEYCIFKLFKIYMLNRKNSYTDLHNAVYAIVHVGEEVKRRFLDVREDEAMEENGDIES